MKKRILFFSLFLLCLGKLFPEPAFHVAKEFENDDCLLSLVEDSEGQKFIVKQVKDESPSEQLLLIIDVCASSIGLACNIPLNQVSLIPANSDFPGKKQKHLPASLHKVVPGIATEDQTPWDDFCIHQRFHRPQAYEKIWGKLLEEQKGLTQEVIEHMKRHPDLAQICAFDTFVGNGDRSNPNLFYDKATNRFWGIDMAASFHSLLAKIVYQRLTNGQQSVSSDLYFSTLKHLHQLFPPQKVEALLKNYILESGYMHEYDQDAWDRLTRHIKVFSENYQFTTLILDYLSDD